MIDLDNQTDFKIAIEPLEHICSLYTQQDIELLIVDNETIQAINKAHRNIDKPTDVLSFPYDSMPFTPLGSIVISCDYVALKAEEFGHTQEEEFTLLFIHGLLHLLGFDHEVDKGEMRLEEAKLIEKLNLPQSLIVRTEG
ncbi:MAG: rRNA maturation RNase YbeY [Epsilonproteobacteria bacterium]|nr:rRNA maturation RNase YbeY [Campylobacterota bacterium]